MLTKRRRNPLNEARWLRFRANKRGYWSLWIFMTLFVFSLFAELIANDKPLLVEYEGAWYYPITTQYALESKREQLRYADADHQRTHVGSG
ncbi:hypothetical protein DVV14_16550 [Vibrio coralliilyticus]|nr:hypothetical protein DVV14_16550 [Vibrio coralliilyticus]